MTEELIKELISFLMSTPFKSKRATVERDDLVSRLIRARAAL